MDNEDRQEPGPLIRTPVLAGALAVIAILTLVLPFWAVRTVHARRLDAAQARLDRLADGLRAAHAAGRLPTDAGLLIGPGLLPRSSDPEWIGGTTHPLAAVDAAAAADPWGNAYVVNAGVAKDLAAAMWVLSAGPNGIIETPFSGPGADPRGDDIAARVR